MKNDDLETHIQTNERLPVLDGLRFLAAFTVLLAHYSYWVLGDQGVNSPLTQILGTLSGLGMPLFFVLSGFVIHYNYHLLYTQPKGIKTYLIARFTRLYPLYIVLFAIEFAIAFHLARGSCGHAGERWGFFLALPYYLTLTQDWIYGIIAHNNLIYQYHMMSAVAWSISLEFFFYLAYLLLSLWLLKQKNILKLIIVFALSQICVVLYLIYCFIFTDTINHVALVGFGPYATESHGYQDSLLRWLYYFNPLVNLPAFFMGTIIAHIYRVTKKKALNKREQACAGWITFGSVLVVWAVHYWFFMHIGPTNGFIGRTASLLNVPLIAVMIYCLVRYSDTFINKWLSLSLFIKLGEASYSIYLLHAFFGWYARDFYYLNLNPWLLYLLAVTCILIMSRCSYVLFERPVQRFLRKKMLNQKAQSVPLSEQLMHSIT